MSDDIIAEPPAKLRTCPFTVIVDTREQAPWRFTGLHQYDVVSLITDTALRSGDYSISGYEDKVAIERKSVGDFLGSISAGRDRFEREMQRLAELHYAAVVVEGDWNDLVGNPPRGSRVTPQSIAGTIASWSIRYGVHFWLCLNRRHAELWTFWLLDQWWRQEQHRGKEEADKAVEAPQQSC